MKRILSIFLLMGLLSFFSCSDGEEIKPMSLYGDFLDISMRDTYLDGNGEVWTTDYSSEHKLTVVSSVPSWLDVNISDHEIKLTASRNDSGSDRYAEITFLSLCHTGTIYVYQEKGSLAIIKEKEMYVFDDGICTDWEFGNDTYCFFYDCISENDMRTYSTDQALLNYLKTGTKYYVSDNIFRRSLLSSSTTYYLCAVPLDKYGNAGQIFKKKFTTRSTSEPVASITSFYLNYSNSWKYNVSLKNNAKKYYAWLNGSNSQYTHEHFLAWYACNQIKSYSLSSTTSTSGSYTSTSSYLHLITVAADSYGNLGNYNYKLAKRSSNSKPISPQLESKEEETPYGSISIDELRKSMIRIE